MGDLNIGTKFYQNLKDESSLEQPICICIGSWSIVKSLQPNFSKAVDIYSSVYTVEHLGF